MEELKMEADYKKAYKEIYEVLITLPEEEVNKVPKNMREMFEVNMDKEYNFKVDINKTFEEQNFSDITKSIIFNLFRDYWATSEQKEKIIEIQNNQRNKLENEKKNKYNIDNIFKSRNENEIINISNENKNLPIQIKNENFFERIINFFKRIFKL